MQQVQTGRPAHHAARTLARSGVVRGEHIGDAVGDGRDGEQCAAAGNAHQGDQTAVKENRKHEHRDHKAAPRALGEREDAAHTHHAGAADGEHLDPHFAAVIRQSDQGKDLISLTQALPSPFPFSHILPAVLPA